MNLAVSLSPKMFSGSGTSVMVTGSGSGGCTTSGTPQSQGNITLPLAA
jgi:hypothetical protein